MGNFEKVVVFLILLVCAVVLAISLRPAEPIEALDAGEPPAEQPAPAPAKIQDGSQLGESGAQVPHETSRIESDADRAAAQPGDGLLSSLVETSGDRKVVLVRTDALRRTVSPDFLTYACRAGDTWPSLAQFYYGDQGRADLLSDANESIDAPIPGRQILVPAYDLVLEGAHRERVEAREVPQFRLYEVQSGDTLSSISKEMFGTGARWMQIFDANRDLLPDPDTLVAGARIRIPRE